MKACLFPVVALLACLIHPSPAAESPLPSPTPASLARQLEADFIAAFEKVAPSVVVIDAAKSATEAPSPFEFFPQMPNDENHRGLRKPAPNFGSGFILKKDGYIVTNNHVIEDTNKIKVHLRDGRTFPANLVGADPRADLAILKIDAKELVAASLGSAETLRIGQWAIAVGAPFNLEYSYSVGWLTGKSRGSLQSNQSISYLQTSAPINPGNSGGPLCDIDGKVIGVNTLIRGIGTGVGFAVPVDAIERVATQILAGGKVTYPWLGLGVESVAKSDAALQLLSQKLERGVLVTKMFKDTPASKANPALKPSDIIIAIDGTKVDTSDALINKVVSKKIGQTVKLTVERYTPGTDKPHLFESSVKLDAMPANAGSLEATEQELPSRADAFGLRVDAAPKGSLGVLIKELEQGGPASVAGLQPGDIITEINRTPLKSISDYQGEATPEQLKKGVLLIYQRKTSTGFAILQAEPTMD